MRALFLKYVVFFLTATQQLKSAEAVMQEKQAFVLFRCYAGADWTACALLVGACGCRGMEGDRREGGYLSSAGPLVVTISSPSFNSILRHLAFQSLLRRDSAIEKLYSHLLSEPLFINVLHSLRVVLY